MKLPQLSLRELFLLVVIAAMGCGWWVQTVAATRSEAERARAEQKVELLKSMLEDNMEMLDAYAPEWRQASRHY